MINNKRIDSRSSNIETAEIDWSKFDVEKAVERLNEEEKAERLEQIVMIIELQGKINELKITWEIVKE